MLVIQFKDSVERLAHVCYVYNIRTGIKICDHILDVLHDPGFNDLIKPLDLSQWSDSEIIDDARGLAMVACHYVADDLRDAFLFGKDTSILAETLRKISKLL